ncbi:FMN reductase [Rhizobium sp. BK538]|nr:FMN reductase [Rhizobium sp. BK538]
MSNDLIVGYSGNISPVAHQAFRGEPSSFTGEAAGLQHTVFDVGDLGTSLAAARSVANLDPAARKVIQTIVEAEASSSVLQPKQGITRACSSMSSIYGMQQTCAVKPVILTGAGGGDRHLLVVEHQLRPLFAFFEACSANGNLPLEPRFHRWQTVNGYTRSRKPGAGGGLHPRAGALRSRRNCSGISTRPARA